MVLVIAGEKAVVLVNCSSVPAGRPFLKKPIFHLHRRPIDGSIRLCYLAVLPRVNHWWFARFGAGGLGTKRLSLSRNMGCIVVHT